MKGRDEDNTIGLQKQNFVLLRSLVMMKIIVIALSVPLNDILVRILLVHQIIWDQSILVKLGTGGILNDPIVNIIPISTGVDQIEVRVSRLERDVPAPDSWRYIGRALW